MSYKCEASESVILILEIYLVCLCNFCDDCSSCRIDSWELFATDSVDKFIVDEKLEKENFYRKLGMGS